MQNSRYTVIPAKISIPKHIEIGKLIGREGRNLKPIAERTGTSISVNTNTNPAQIEIKIIKIRTHNNTSIRPSTENQINEAKDQLNDLMKNIEKERKNRLIKEDKKKETRDDFHRNNAATGHQRQLGLKHQKEINLKKERRESKREMMSMINSYKKK